MKAPAHISNQSHTHSEPVLSEDKCRELAQQLPGEWSLESNQALLLSVNFSSFADAMVYVNDIAALAESANHHPDITISYRTVTLSLSTHDAGGITERDFTLAQQIENCC